MKMEEKLNSADFADKREQAMLRSRKAGNPGLRMVPQDGKAASSEDAPAPPPRPAAPIDYDATSRAILDALRKVDGDLRLSASERREAVKLVAPRDTTAQAIYYACGIVVSLLLGFVAGKYQGRSRVRG